LFAAKEAAEVLANPEGRWMSFSINNEDKVILQKSGLPEHLSKLENLDVPVTLQSLILDLQDAGEVTLIWIMFSKYSLHLCCDSSATST